MRDSSIQAHEDVKPRKAIHYKAIKKALIKIGKPATSKTISQNCDLSYHQVARRLSEMETKGDLKTAGRAEDIKNRPILWELNG